MILASYVNRNAHVIWYRDSTRAFLSAIHDRRHSSRFQNISLTQLTTEQKACFEALDPCGIFVEPLCIPCGTLCENPVRPLWNPQWDYRNSTGTGLFQHAHRRARVCRPLPSPGGLDRRTQSHKVQAKERQPADDPPYI